MAKKYYAVKIGRKPGIYKTWDECKEEVRGFKGAEYKGFETEEQAENYISGKTVDGVTKKNAEAVAYVDGSYDNEMKKYSWGAVIFLGNKEVQLSGSGSEEGMLQMRNVAGEIESAMKSIEYCVNNGINSLLIYHDYQGVGKWADNLWKTNLPETAAYKKYVSDMRKKHGIKISFEHVKGHSGNEYNELADKLAKEALKR